MGIYIADDSVLFLLVCVIFQVVDRFILTEDLTLNSRDIYSYLTYVYFIVRHSAMAI